MSTAAPHSGRCTRSLFGGLLFPSLQVRASIALFATFFPYGVFYSLPYPGPELLLFLFWFWVFPSRVGFLFLLLLPAVPTETYGYYAFNVFCAGESFAIALAALQAPQLSREAIARFYKPAFWCAALTLLLCFWQAMSGGQSWAQVPGQIIPAGRGPGLRSEPSLLAGPLMAYIALLLVHIAVQAHERSRRRTLLAGLMMIVGFVAVTRSLSILVVVLAFFPLVLFRRGRMGLALMGAVSGALLGLQLFGDRIEQALSGGSASFVEAITVGVGSWRNIPDLIVIANAPSYLWPGNPLEMRAKLAQLAASISPIFAWLDSTYSMFSACATSVGIVATTVLMVTGLVVALRRLPRGAPIRGTWIALYIICWFLAPKYDVIGWVALGVLPWIRQPVGESRATARAEAFSRRNAAAALSTPSAAIEPWPPQPPALENV